MAGNNKRHRKSAGTANKLKTVTPVLIRHSKTNNDLLKQKPYLHLDCFSNGTAAGINFHSIFYRIAVGFSLCGFFKEDDVVAKLILASSSILKIKERYNETGSWIIQSSEYLDIKEAFKYVDEMQDRCTRHELLDAFLKAKELMEDCQ